MILVAHQISLHFHWPLSKIMISLAFYMPLSSHFYLFLFFMTESPPARFISPADPAHSSRRRGESVLSSFSASPSDATGAQEDSCDSGTLTHTKARGREAVSQRERLEAPVQFQFA